MNNEWRGDGFPIHTIESPKRIPPTKENVDQIITELREARDLTLKAIEKMETSDMLKSMLRSENFDHFCNLEEKARNTLDQ